MSDICTHNVIVCRPEQTLSGALAQFGAHNVGRLPVIDPQNPDRIVGILNRSNILQACSEAHQQGAQLAPKADALKSQEEENAMVIVQAPISAGSLLARVHVRDAHFPPDSTLGALRRAHKTVLPKGSTELLPGDVLIVLTTRENESLVRKWLREQC